MARATHQSVLVYPLTPILGTDAGVRLLRGLARHGGQLSAPDLVRRTGLAKASVARGLASLREAGMVAIAGTGRSLLHRLATHCRLRCQRCLRRRSDGFSPSSRASEAPGRGWWRSGCNGSVARGEDRTDSDLDLALIVEPDALSRLTYVLRLAPQRDPWRTGVTRDAFPLIGARSEELAAVLAPAAERRRVA